MLCSPYPITCRGSGPSFSGLVDSSLLSVCIVSITLFIFLSFLSFASFSVRFVSFLFCSIVFYFLPRVVAAFAAALGVMVFVTF